MVAVEPPDLVGMGEIIGDRKRDKGAIERDEGERAQWEYK
jgi:hypothetical protein